MVKVLPTTFSLFESQNIINPSAEPLCINCSDDHVFIACEGCVLEVYTLSTRHQVAKIRTIWPASAVAYNKHADCIVTVEARNLESSATSRVYFKWRGIGDFSRPQKVVLMGSGSKQESVDAEIVELPVDNCSCVAVCDLTGVIAVGSERMIRLFSLVQEPMGSLSTGGYKLISMLDIRTDMKLRDINLCANYVACISTHRIRVIRFHVMGTDNHPWHAFQSNIFNTKPQPKSKHGRRNTTINECPKDKNFLSWSPSHVWEAETKQPLVKTTVSVDPTATIAAPSTPSDTSSPPPIQESINGNIKRSSIPWLSPTRPSLQQIPNLSTITLPAITTAITEARRDSGKHELEVLGPVEYVWGQPLTVTTHEELGHNVTCRALTMLYRRFASTGYAYVHVSSNESSLPTYDSLKHRSATISGTGRGTMGASPSSGGKYRGGIHTVQLVPTLAPKGSSELIGMTCVLANRTKGFMYDIYDKTKLITSVSFMTRSQTVCYDGSYFHALSGEAVDSYTSRVISSVISRKNQSPAVVTGHTNWIGQPCPSSVLELTLISSNKFIGCYDLMTTPTHNVVLCKLSDGSPTIQPAASASFLESISIRGRRKRISKGTWNIYVLEKKPVLGMYRQFVEFAKTLDELSPPMMLHHLSEAHLLLRSSAVSETTPSQEAIDLLKDNCFTLAQSMAVYSNNDRSVPVMAAGYYLLSGKSILEVVKHIMSLQPEGVSKLPYVILVKYLNMVLFEPANSSQVDSLLPLADQILEFYTKYDSDRLPDFILFSWFKGYSNEKAIELLQLLLPKVKTSHNSNISVDIINVALCSLLCGMDQLDKAVSVLIGVSDNYLLQWVKDNHHFMINMNTKEMTVMGKVVRLKSDGIFREMLSHLLLGNQLEWAGLCSILHVNDPKVIIEDQVLKKILEDIVIGNVVLKPAISYLATELLITVLVKRVLSSANVETNSSCVQFGTRHSWLNKLPPFENSVVEKRDNILYNSSSQSYLRDLVELQSLLCSSHMSHDLAAHADHVRCKMQPPPSEGNDVIMTSLKLLNWPLLGKPLEAVKLVIDHFPYVLVDYCKVYFKADLSKWKLLLEELLHRLNSVNMDDNEQMNTLKSIYQDSMRHVATLTTPRELLSLLPPNGNIMFFLPVVEYSCKLFMASNVANTMHTILNDN